MPSEVLPAADDVWPADLPDRARVEGPVAECFPFSSSQTVPFTPPLSPPPLARRLHVMNDVFVLAWVSFIEPIIADRGQRVCPGSPAGADDGRMLFPTQLPFILVNTDDYMVIDTDLLREFLNPRSGSL